MPSDPDATPEARFRAYLAKNEAASLPARIPWRERWRRDAGVFLALAGVLAASAAIAWWKA